MEREFQAFPKLFVLLFSNQYFLCHILQERDFFYQFMKKYGKENTLLIYSTSKFIKDFTKIDKLYKIFNKYTFTILHFNPGLSLNITLYRWMIEKFGNHLTVKILKRTCFIDPDLISPYIALIGKTMTAKMIRRPTLFKLLQNISFFPYFKRFVTLFKSVNHLILQDFLMIRLMDDGFMNQIIHLKSIYSVIDLVQILSTSLICCHLDYFSTLNNLLEILPAISTCDSLQEFINLSIDSK
jgi:hypothetical protein